MIPVTKPFIPPIEEYKALLEGVWERKHLTNNGPLVSQLESNLIKYLDVPNLLFVSNGTIALQIAIKALGITKKIITTPFSYVATTSSIVWEGCTPVFVDIDPKTLNIDPSKIEAVIDKDTEAILATHSFGNPCDIDAIDRIAKENNLRVIYDAAHCFGTKYKGKSIFTYGDISTVSFHATKLFHTVEGGAVFSNDEEIVKKMSFLRNFGHDGPINYSGVGINGKNSELHAAMGLVNLNYIETILTNRKSQSKLYDSYLMNSSIKKPVITENSTFNYAYYPIIFQSEALALVNKEILEKHNIFPRRYFYPSLNNLEYVNGNKMPVAEDISKRILCLPLYYGLSEVEQKIITSHIISI